MSMLDSAGPNPEVKMNWNGRLAAILLPAFLLATGPSLAGKELSGHDRLLDLAKQAHDGGAKPHARNANPDLPRNVLRLTQSTGKKSWPSWSPDGKAIYYADQGGGPTRILRKWIGGGEPDTVVAEKYWAAKEPAISPDGAYLAYQSERADTKRSIWIRRLSDGLEGKLNEQTDAVESGPAWSDTGARLFFNRRGPNSMRYRAVSCLRNGDALKVVGLEQSDYFHPTVSPDGREVAWILRNGRESRIVLVSSELSAIARDVRTPGYAVASMDWMPDGRRMIVSYMDNSVPDRGFDLGILDTEEASIERVLNLGHYDSDPKVSPDGRSVAFIANPDGRPQLYLWTLPDSLASREGR